MLLIIIHNIWIKQFKYGYLRCKEVVWKCFFITNNLFTIFTINDMILKRKMSKQKSCYLTGVCVLNVYKLALQSQSLPHISCRFLWVFWTDLQRGEDNLVHRGKISVPQHLCPLSESQDSLIAHRPDCGWHLKTQVGRTRWEKKSKSKGTNISSSVVLVLKLSIKIDWKREILIDQNYVN